MDSGFNYGPVVAVTVGVSGAGGEVGVSVGGIAVGGTVVGEGGTVVSVG